MINQVALTGRLTKDIDLRYTNSGKAVAQFTLAVNRQFTNANGEREADFINCQVWGKSAEAMADNLQKGSLIGIEGRIQTSSYDNQEGVKVFTTTVVCASFSFLEAKSSNTSQANAGAQGQSKPPATNNQNADPFANNGQPIDISDDDLPFQGTHMKTDETLRVEKALVLYTRKIGTYGIKEVSLRKNAYESISERVDYVTIDNSSVIRCYEIKVTKSDFLSKANLSYWGDFNYLVVSAKLFEEIKVLDKYKQLLFLGVGVIVVSDQKMSTERNPKKKQVSISQRVAVIESMAKSAGNQLLKYYTE